MHYTTIMNNFFWHFKYKDTAGQERFMAFAPSWLRNAEVIILVYDITSRESFTELRLVVVFY